MNPEMASFPRVLRDSLLAPYVDGVLFVHALRRRGGWPLVDRVWSNPPTTTEQVLHLDKLDSREPAESVPVPVPPTAGPWTTVHSDVYGEQGLRIALEEWMPRRVAVDAAQGWAGDRVAVLHLALHDSTVAVAAWHVRFDLSPAQPDSEAISAFQALASGWGVATPGSSFCHTLQNGRLVAVAREGRDMALVAGPEQTAVDTPVSNCSLLSKWATAVAAQY